MPNELKFTVKIDGNTHQATVDANELSDAFSKVKRGIDNINAKKLNFAAVVASCEAVGNSLGRLQSSVAGLTQLYAAQEAAEAKLAQVMRNTMGASDEEVVSIKALASAQQELGVVGDEVQLAGAQELATYLGLSSSLETLLPVMNDMIAQQYGLNATQEGAAQIATMMGKVMEGQTAALSRYGYSFTEAQEKILKFGTEEQKAATLAAVIEESVGGVNAALAQTSSGQMQQLANTIGDVKERIGEVLANAQPAISILSEIGMATSSILTIGNTVKTVAVRFATFTKEVIANKVALVAHAVQQKVCSAATKAWTAIQTIFNAVMTMNPIGIVVTAIGALVAAIVVAYKKCEGFRNVVNQVFQAWKKVASIVYGPVIKAFKTVCGWISKAWEWLKKFLGITDDGKVEMKVTVEDNTDTLDFDGIASTIQDPNKPDAVIKKDAAPVGSLKALQDAISAKKTELNLAVSPDSRVQIQKEIDLLTSRKDAIELEITAKVKGFDTVQDYLMSLDEFEFDEDNIDIEPLAKDLKVVTRETKKAKSATDNASESFGAMGALMNNVGECVGGAAQAWLQYGANLLNTVAQAIPAIAQMISANAAETASENTKTTAKVASASAQTMETYSSIPFVGIALGLAGIAAIVAAMMSLPKFAAGGIAYGPTLGLMGEYAGASNNPEVIAPLNKLRSLLNIDGSAGGKVDFEIRGRKLVGVLAKETSVRSRR